MKNNTVQQNIPNGWKRKALRDLVSIKKGEQLNRLAMDDAGKYPALNGGINPSGYTDKWNTEACTITISEGGNSCGFVNFNTEKFWCGGHCYALLNINGDLDVNFLYQFLKSKQSQIMKLRVGSGLPNIQKRNIDEFPVVFPKSKTEQQKIAEILGTVDEDIAIMQEVIEATEKLKRGLMQQLFTRGIGHTKFKETKIGQIPEEWDVLELGKVCDVRDGTHSSPKYHEEGYPLITSKNLVDNGLDFDNVSLISETDFREIERRSGVDDGDILFGMIGTIGNPVIVQKYRDFAIKNVALIKFNKSKMNNVFVLNFLKSTHTEKQFNQKKGGSTQKFIALGVIRQILITVPSQREQKEISEILSTVDEKISVNKKLKEKLTLLKKGLMQDLLNGRVRTITN